MKTTQIKTVDEVDINKFMGDWYVIAHIPSYVEGNAFNAGESYKLNDDGSIATTFTFNEGSVDGPVKTYHPKGFIVPNTNNAIWGMQFIWPIKADFRVVYLDPDYQYTVIGRKARDYVWIMARSPDIDEQKYQELIDFAVSIGYPAEKIERAPHKIVPQSES